MAIKNFGLEGVSTTLQFGKSGPSLEKGTTGFDVRDNAGSLTVMRGADATASDEFVTLSQLTGVAGLGIAGDSGTDTLVAGTDTLTFVGDTGLTTTVTDNTVTIDLDDTAVTTGSYGSSTEIPTFTVDQQGRITAAGTASISTDLSISGDTGTDTVSLGADTLSFVGDTGLTTTITDNTVTIDLDDTAVTTGSYGSATEIPTFTVDQQGRITAAGTASISTSFTIGADVGSDDLVNTSETINFTGDTGITTTVSDNAISIDLDDTAVTAGSYGTTATVPSLTIDQQGRVTAASDVTLALSGSYSASAGTVAVSDTLEAAIEKIDGNIALKQNSLTDGDGVLLTGDTLSVDLYLPGTPDNTTLSISGANSPSFADGEWAEIGDFSISGASTGSATFTASTGHRAYYRDSGADHYIIMYNTTTPGWICHHYNGGSSFSTATNGATMSSVGGSFQAGQGLTVSGSSTVGGLLSPDEGAVGGGTMAFGTIGTGAELLEFVSGQLAVKVKDEDDMVSDSDSHVPTQQSVKAYVDTQVGAIASTLDITDGTATDTVNTGEAITFTGGTGITTAVTDNEITFTNDGVTSITGTTGEVEVDVSTGAVTIGLPDDVTISGNLTVSGTTTTVNSTNVEFGDSTLHFGSGNVTADVIDTGAYGSYSPDAGSTVYYHGFFRDASDSGKYKFVDTLTNEPGSTFDLTGATTSTLVANIEGNITGDLTGNADTATALETSRNITLSGDATGTASFDGTADAAITVTIAAGAIEETMFDAAVDAETFLLSSGFAQAAGTVAIGDSIEEAIEKLDGNIASLVSAANSISQGDSNITVTDAGTGEIAITVDGTNVADFNTSGLVIESGATLTVDDLTSGVVFTDASGVLSVDAGFSYDGTTDILSVENIDLGTGGYITNSTDAFLDIRSGSTGTTITTSDGSTVLAQFEGVAGDDNYLSIESSDTNPIITAEGLSANVSIEMTPKGTGVVLVPTGYEANITADEAIVNKKYVDDAISTSNAVAGSTHTMVGTVDLTSATAQTIGTLPAASYITSIKVVVTAASDAVSTVVVGSSTNATMMADTENDPEVLGTYVAETFFSNTAEAITATVATAGTVGSATVLVEYSIS